MNLLPIYVSTTTNNKNSNYNELSKQFLDYINYELSFFEKNAYKKFLFNISSNDRFELKVSKSKEDYNDKSKFQIIYRANNLYHYQKFIDN